MLETESKLMFEVERCACWVVVVIDKVVDFSWDCDALSRIDRFSLGPIGGGFQRGRDGSRGEQGSSQRY